MCASSTGWCRVVSQGDKLHWLACALYVACRSATVATVGGGESQGNSVSLTQILRCSGLRYEKKNGEDASFHLLGSPPPF